MSMSVTLLLKSFSTGNLLCARTRGKVRVAKRRVEKAAQVAMSVLSLVRCATAPVCPCFKPTTTTSASAPVVWGLRCSFRAGYPAGGHHWSWTPNLPLPAGAIPSLSPLPLLLKQPSCLQFTDMHTGSHWPQIM